MDFGKTSPLRHRIRHTFSHRHSSHDFITPTARRYLVRRMYVALSAVTQAHNGNGTETVINAIPHLPAKEMSTTWAIGSW